MNTKFCTKCNIEKDLLEFHNRSSSSDGKAYICKECGKRYKIDNKVHIAEYDKQDRRVEYQKQYEIINKEHLVEYRKQYRKQYYVDNKDYIVKYNKQYQKDHPEMVRDVNTKNNARRRGWGTPQPLNEYFPDSHLHHLHTINSTTGEIDHRVAIYIPTELHKSVWHSNTNRESMLAINELAFAYLYTILN